MRLLLLACLSFGSLAPLAGCGAQPVMQPGSSQWQYPAHLPRMNAGAAAPAAGLPAPLPRKIRR